MSIKNENQWIEILTIDPECSDVVGDIFSSLRWIQSELESEGMDLVTAHYEAGRRFRDQVGICIDAWNDGYDDQSRFKK
jgi:hypothetical protein